MADHNNEGHLHALVRCLESEPWAELWSSLNLPVVNFVDLNLEPETSDLILWKICQEQGLVLLTINRNSKGTDSLEQTIQQLTSATTLPVLTLANPKRILREKSYLNRVAERLLEILLDIDKYRGTGRLYLP